MPEYIYSLRDVRKAHGDKVVLDDVTLSFLPGAKIGVVGPNGAGKSTLLKIMAGIEQASNGDAKLTPGFTVGILAQEPKLDEDKTVLDNVEEGVAETKKLLDGYNEIAEKMATDYSDELMDEMGKLQEQIDHADAWDLDSQLEQAMDALRCPPADVRVTSLSGGERRRVALCKLLLQQPDLLLLDEPTNHLDAESVLWLEQHLAKYPGTVIAVTHDRYFLDNVAQWILELDRGRAYPYEGNYSTYLETKAARLKVEGAKDAEAAQAARRRARVGPLQRQGPPDQVEGATRAVRGDGGRGRQEPQARLRGDPDPAGPAPRQHRRRGREPGQGLRRPRAHRRPVLHPAAERHRRRHRPERRRQDHAVQDDRGRGEAGRRHDPDRRHGQDLLRRPEPRSHRPEQERLGGRLRRRDFIHVGNVEIPSRAYVAAFGFKGPDQQKPAGVLSGGERNRLNLALTLKQGGNLLLLDEPTNDLDVETLGSLENALLEFPGCAVVISHDRWFLDRVATHILAWEGGANWFWFEGNFESYEKNKIERLGAEAARPHRVTYRKLTRG